MDLNPAVMPITTHVKGDEYAFNLAEANQVDSLTHQWYRFQIIWVVRDDKLTMYRE